MIVIKHNFEALKKQINDVQKRQLPFATSLAINKTAQKVKTKEEHEMRDVFDRPTPYTLASVFISPSNKQSLTAKVGLKDTALKAIPAAKYLQAQIKGGERALKRYERALRSIGVLPDGYFTVPGAGAKMNGYGNLNNGQLRKILSYFRSNKDSGVTSNSTDKTRAKLRKGTKKEVGISYFAGSPGGGKLPLGIWEIAHTGFGKSQPRPILIFIRDTDYEPVFDFKYVAETTVDKEFNCEFIKAWEYAKATAR